MTGSVTMAQSQAQPILPSENSTSAINSLLARGRQVNLVNTGKPYILDDTLVFGPNARLVGEPGTIIKLTTSKTAFRIPDKSSDVKLINITFDGTGLTQSRPISICSGQNFSWIGGGAHNSGPLFLNAGCDHALIKNLKIDFSSAGAIVIEGGSYDRVVACNFNNNMGFGIFVTAGGNHFKLEYNRSNSNAIEMIGISYSAHDGDIIGNHVTRSGDNCISVSGKNIHVLNNFVANCLGSGIAVYGNDDVVRYNRAENNGQIKNPLATPIELWGNRSKVIYQSSGYSLDGNVGISVAGAFGGYGQHNIIDSNSIIDSQKTPTQDGIKILTGTAEWKPGSVKAGEYVFAGGSTYLAITDGISHTMPKGLDSYQDGALIWKWCSRPSSATREASGNIVTNNSIVGYISYAIRDFTTGANNFIR